MLTIKKIPTVVSIYQDGGVERPGCGRNCLGPCCIPGAKLPVYIFSGDKLKGRSHGVLASSDSDSENADSQSGMFLDSLLLAQWEERSARGLFRYDVTACETKILPGEFGFIAQLNEGRHLKKRPTEFRVDQVLQCFDAKKFNFTKVGQEEVLFCFEESKDYGGYCDEMAVGKSPNIIAINVSPIEYGHVLLVPKLLDCKPQQIDEASFRLALNFAVEAQNPSFRVGYNSLGAFATINHLHFQAYYLAAPFPVERAEVKRIGTLKKMKASVKVFELANYAVRGLVYECVDGLDHLAECVARACISLQENNIPFNALIADCGMRVFLFPQCFAEKQALGLVDQSILDTQVNPAVWEISGHIVLKQREDYESVTEDYAWKLLAEVSLSGERFSQVKKLCLEASWKEGNVRLKDSMFSFMPEQSISGKNQVKNFRSMSLQETTV